MSKRVLVISHNVFSKTENMGKTLMSYFATWESKDIAQFYIHSEVPTDRITENYYRVTDKDILKSIIKRKSGDILTGEDVIEERVSARTDTGMTAKIYQKSRSRTPFVYFARNLLWSLGKWNTKKLKRWLDEFDPEAVFFASGDYAFMYKIALKLAKKRNIPLYISCVDDYYLDNKNKNDFGGKFVYKSFMKAARKALDYASAAFCICDKMSREYSEKFGIKCYTLHTPATFDAPLEMENKTNRISYIGNLGFDRNLQLIALSRALKNIDCPGKPDMIDVYSAEKREEILSGMAPENGIRFNGEINTEDVKRIMAESMILVHTETFKPETKNRIKYSVSTKIADSLQSGTCLLAYGPEDIASVEYLNENNAAFCITRNDDIEQSLKKIIEDAGIRSEIIENALRLARRNHGRLDASDKIAEVLEQIKTA